MTALVLIPARLGSTRLPEKPLAPIAGLPMIVHVARRARESSVGRVVVATDSESVKLAVEHHGFEAVMTAATHESGSDRIWEALSAVDPEGRIERIVNVQGDLPTLDPTLVGEALALLDEPEVAIGTLGVEISRDEERTNPNVVKIVGTPLSETRLRALLFTRTTAPWGEGPHFHHVGLYAYRRSALQRFVALPPSTLERREKLEQLRALEAGMRIDVALVGGVPLGVDTHEDLERARAALS